MAPQHPFGSQPETHERPVNFYRLNGIGGTGGNMPAGGRCQRGNGIFVKVDRDQQDPGEELQYEFYGALHGSAKIPLFINRFLRG